MQHLFLLLYLSVRAPPPHLIKKQLPNFVDDPIDGAAASSAAVVIVVVVMFTFIGFASVHLTLLLSLLQLLLVELALVLKIYAYSICIRMYVFTYV